MMHPKYEDLIKSTSVLWESFNVSHEFAQIVESDFENECFDEVENEIDTIKSMFSFLNKE